MQYVVADVCYKLVGRLLCCVQLLAKVVSRLHLSRLRLNVVYSLHQVRASNDACVTCSMRPHNCVSNGYSGYLV